MRHARVIIGLLALHIIATGVPALAQEEATDITKDDAWEICVRTLGISEELALKGTYKIRIGQCIDQSHTASTEHVESIRRELRIRRVQRMFNADPGSFFQTRITTSPSASDILMERARAQHEQLDLLREIKANIRYTRPSRRGIKEHANSQTRATKAEESDAYRERWNKAVQACGTMTNNFLRTNCIRSELRKLGE